MADINPDYLAGLAQLETAGGNKSIPGTNNLYNIKDFSGGGIKAHDKAEGSNDAYRVYASAADSTKDVTDLLTRKYPKAVTAKSPQEFAQALKDGGYATDPDYVRKLTNTIVGGNYDANAMKAAGAAPPLRTLAPVSTDGEWDAPLDERAEHAARPKASALNEFQKTGIVRAGIELGPEGSAAARAQPSVAGDLGVERNLPNLTPSGDQFDAARAANAADVGVEKARDAVGFRDQVGAAVMNNADVRWFSRKIAGTPDQGAPVPGYSTPDEALVGKTEEQRRQLTDATNPMHLLMIQSEQDQEEDRLKTIGAHGGWSAFAASALGTLADPMTYVGPYGAAKALKAVGVGSAALSAAGRTVPATLAAFGENAVANVAQDQINASIAGEHRTGGDVFGAMSMALIPGVLHGASAWGAASREAQAALHLKAIDTVVAKQKELQARAQGNLGEGATVDQIRGEMDRLEAGDYRKVAESNVVTPIDNNRQLMPHPDRVKEDIDIEREAATKAESETPVAEKPEEETAPISAGNEGAPERTDSRGDIDKDATAAARKELPADATIEERAMATRYHGEQPVWDKAGQFEDEQRLQSMRSGGASKGIEGVEGVRVNWLERQKPGAYVLPGAAAHTRLQAAMDAGRALVKQFLPDSHVAFGIAKEKNITVGAGHPEGGTVTLENPAYNAAVWSGGKVHVVGVRDNLSPSQALQSVTHEIGHAIFHENARNIPTDLLGRMVAEHGQFLQELREGRAQARFKRSAEGGDTVLSKDGTLKGKMDNTSYVTNFDEYTAEAFVRYVQRKAREGGGPELPKSALDVFAQAWDKIKELWTRAKAKGYLAKDEAFDEFFDRVLKGTLTERVKQTEALPEHFDSGLRLPDFSMQQGEPPRIGAQMGADLTQQKYGLDTLPEGTAAEAGEKRMITALYQRADAWAKANPMDEAWMKRASALTDNGVFNVASTGLLMLKSKNPVARMIAAELLEDAGGVVGHRNSTAAISKYTHERLFLGNTINDLQDSFTQWKKTNGGSAWDDLMTGQGWDRYNRAIAEEIETRRANGGTRSPGVDVHVGNAADSLEAGYERMRKAQIANETLGWAGLPATSKGYMPHKMSSRRVRELTPEEVGVLHSSMVDQFINMGWDTSFSANLAGRYIDRIRQKALGGYDAPIGAHETGSADIVEDAMRAMGLSRQEIAANMRRYYNAGPGHTKGRLNLDLLSQHSLPQPDGSVRQIRLLDLFETNQMQLMRTQAGRVSGEVALARHGVYGKPGLALMRRAMGYGAADGMAVPKELEAFDQVAAEFLHEPFGTQEGKWMERARTLNSVARLGGIVFNQFAEFINGIAHVGVGRTIGAISSIGRLRGEIIALSKGQHVNNPLLTSIEHMSGAEFGTDAYKIAFPFDSPDAALPTYGKDTITATDRLLRGSAHLQAKISFWRAIHSAQNRGFAEQIVQKAVQFIREGKDDAALNDMGIHAGIRSRLAADLPNMATFGPDGRLQSFDLMKSKDRQAAEAFSQAVLRGTQQIIQGTFIGETGKWAHSGYLKMLTQFRSFSITSVEKQWARQKNNQGTAKALGILVGSMSIAVPVYMARVYANSIGQPDRQKYLDTHLTPFALTRATMNYIALSGLAGDFLDATTAIAPDAVKEAIGGPSGGRSGQNKTAVGNIIAPAAGYVDDVWSTLQNLDKPSKALRILPFSNVPFLVPAINALQQ